MTIYMQVQCPLFLAEELAMCTVNDRRIGQGEEEAELRASPQNTQVLAGQARDKVVATLGLGSTLDATCCLASLEEQRKLSQKLDRVPSNEKQKGEAHSRWLFASTKVLRGR